MCKDVEHRVKEFVAETAGVRVGRLHLDTTLLGDLGIDGDDANDFFIEFRDRFNVDVSSLDLSEHFGPEGWPWWGILLPVVWLWDFFLKEGSLEEKANLTPIRISKLCEAVRLGRWVPESKTMEENAELRRHHFQFSLRTVFVVMSGVCVASLLLGRIKVSDFGPWYYYPPLEWVLAWPVAPVLVGNVMLAVSIKLARNNQSVVSAWCWFVTGWHFVLADVAWYTIHAFEVSSTHYDAQRIQQSIDVLLAIDLWLPLFFSVLAADVFIRKRRMLGRREAIMIGGSLLVAGVNLIVLCVLLSNLLKAIHIS